MARWISGVSTWISGVSMGAVLILGCVVAAYLVTSLVAFLLPGAQPHGREIFLPIAVIAATLIATTGFWWSLARHHGWTEMLASLVPIEILVSWLILLFSGSPGIDSFFINSFFAVNLFLGAPWLVAIGLSVIFKARSRG